MITSTRSRFEAIPELTQQCADLARACAVHTGHHIAAAYEVFNGLEFSCERPGCGAKTFVSVTCPDDMLRVDWIGPQMMQWCQGEGAPPVPEVSA